MVAVRKESAGQAGFPGGDVIEWKRDGDVVELSDEQWAAVSGLPGFSEVKAKAEKDDEAAKKPAKRTRSPRPSSR